MRKFKLIKEGLKKLRKSNARPVRLKTVPEAKRRLKRLEKMFAADMMDTMGWWMQNQGASEAAKAARRVRANRRKDWFLSQLRNTKMEGSTLQRIERSWKRKWQDKVGAAMAGSVGAAHYKKSTEKDKK